MSRVPRIRFKGFEEDWEQRKLVEVAIFNPKSKLPSTFEYVDLESVIGTEIVSHSTETINTAPSRAQRLAKKGDIFYQTVRPYQKNNYLFEKDRGNYVFSTGYAQLRPFVNERFLFYLIQNGNFVNMVLYNCTGTSYPAINSSDLRRIDIYLSRNSTEQKCIGNTIKSLDHLITLHQRKLEKLKIIKKSMLENLFPQNGEKTPKIRFSGFTKDWEQRKMGEVADIIGGGTPSTLNLDYWDGNIDWYSPAEIIDQIYVDRSQRKITELGFEKSSAKMLPEGTVLFTSRAGIGKTAILAKKGCTNQGFQSIVPHSNKLDSYFIFSRTEELKKYGELVGAGSTFVEVSGRQMENMQLMIPKTIGEQHIIGVLFSTFDHLITLHQSKLDKLQKIKKSMLESMFV